MAKPNGGAERAARRFRPGLLPTLGMLVVVAASVRLGNWQADRAAYKSALASRMEHAAAAAAVEVTPATAAEGGLAGRRASASGEFVPSAQMLLDNRVLDGRVGYQVLTPLRLAGSDACVLVDRGWVVAGRTRSAPPSPQPPAGRVTVIGRIAVPAPATGEARAAGDAASVWQRIDTALMARASGLALLPLVVEQTAPAASGDDLPRERNAPEFGIEKHRSYMFQWYSLAGLAVVLWLALNWRRGQGERRG